MTNKEGQAWGFDLIIASIIFTIGIATFFLYSLNYPVEGQETIDIFSYEGELIAENLLSEGFPQNWDENNVISIGLLNEGKINQTKLDRFINLSIQDYSRTKNLFNTKYNYYVKILDTDVEIIGQQPSDPKNLIKITRYTIYQNKPVTLNVYIWE